LRVVVPLGPTSLTVPSSLAVRTGQVGPGWVAAAGEVVANTAPSEPIVMAAAMATTISTDVILWRRPVVGAAPGGCWIARGEKARLVVITLISLSGLSADAALVADSLVQAFRGGRVDYSLECGHPVPKATE
jgi:hypothetical protein